MSVEVLRTTSPHPGLRQRWETGEAYGKTCAEESGWYRTHTQRRGEYITTRVRLRAALARQNRAGESFAKRFETLKRLAWVEGYLTQTAITGSGVIDPTSITYAPKLRPQNKRYIGYVSLLRGITEIEYQIRKDGKVNYWLKDSGGEAHSRSSSLPRDRVFDSPRLLLIDRVVQLRARRDEIEQEILRVEAQASWIDVTDKEKEKEKDDER